jgi:hypothetical protein
MKPTKHLFILTQHLFLHTLTQHLCEIIKPWLVGKLQIILFLWGEPLYVHMHCSCDQEFSHTS